MQQDWIGQTLTTESAEAAAAQAIARCQASTVVFYVDTLEHLRRGGRIGAASAFLGSALAIKPILTLKNGPLSALEKVRTSRRARAPREELAVAAAGRAPADADGVDISVHHLDSATRADDLAGRLRARVESAREVRVVELGAVVGAHVGPGTIAVAVSPRLAVP